MKELTKDCRVGSPAHLRLTVLGLTLSALVSVLATPDDQERSGDELARGKHLFPSASSISGAQLIAKRDEYLRERNWNLGFWDTNPHSAYLGWGQAQIQASPEDPRYGQSRILAYETALLLAKGEFVRFRERVTTTETLLHFFPGSQEIPEPLTEASRRRVISEKTLALTEAQLDLALEKAGVDPAQFQREPVESRRQLMKDSIRRTIRTRALASVAGVRVIATFEDLNHVGVLIVYSDNLRELARSMIVGGRTGAADLVDQRKSILNQIDVICPNGAEDLAQVFGVRVMTDENGDQILVAFGQWSPAVTRADSPFRRNTAISAARAQAMNLAEAALTDFVNSTVQLEENSSVWQSAELNLITSGAGVREEEALAIGELLERTLKQHGKVRLQGVTTIKEWTANHPETGHLLVGHVLMWSPTTREAAVHGLKPPISIRGPITRSNFNENRIRISPDFDR